MKKQPFKPGDKVYATTNSVWGLAPMIVRAVSDTHVSCKAPDMGGSMGAFAPSELELVTPERTARIEAYLKLVNGQDKMKSDLFGTKG